jgi:hypothetical protein
VNEPHDPFAVDTGNALVALMLTWQDLCDEIRADGGSWTAHIRDAPGDELITAPTPDALNVKLREEWLGGEGDRG